jgi:hypothetical protein
VARQASDHQGPGMEFDEQIACHEPIYPSNRVKILRKPSTYFFKTGKMGIKIVETIKFDGL